MATTQLFVELLVIGFGALAALVILGAAFFGYEPAYFFFGALSTKTALPAIAVAYLLGIVTDRAADRLFERPDRRYRKEFFGDDKARYFDARRTLIVHAPALWEHLEYGRSRLRICRGWALNAVLLLVAVDAFAFARLTAMVTSMWNIVAGNVFLVLFGILCAYCWRELARKEYQKIRRQSAWIEKQQEGESNVKQESNNV